MSNQQTNNNRVTYKFPTEYGSYTWCEISVLLERKTNDKGYEEPNSVLLLTIGLKDKDTGRRNFDSKITVSLMLNEIVNIREIVRALNYGYDTALSVMTSIYGKSVSQNNKNEHCILFHHINPRTNKGVNINVCITKDNGIRISAGYDSKSGKDKQYYSFKFSFNRRNVLLAYLDKAIDLMLSNTYT